MTLSSHPTLPLLKALLSQVKSQLDRRISLDRTLVVGNQHLLPSTCSLVQSILSMGIPAKNIVLTGKLYSCRKTVVTWLRAKGVSVIAPPTSPILPGNLLKIHEDTLTKFWEHVLALVEKHNSSQIVLLDDGGYGVLSIPIEIVRKHTIVAIEQTKSGLRVKGPFVKVRRINVAASAVKLKIESPIIGDSIARAVVMKVKNLREQLGVVGAGNVGGAVMAALTKMGFEVFAFDKNTSKLPREVRQVGNLEELCRRCSVIIGCTGEDIFAGAEWLGTLGKEITLISGSSQDIEFRSVLKTALRNPLRVGSDVRIPIGNGIFNVVFCGFPINFAGNGELESPSDIQLTRALLFGGLLQALFCSTSEKEGASATKTPEQLNGALQRYIARNWCHIVGAKKEVYESFESLRWIESNSGGTPTRCNELMRVFAD